MSLKERLGLDQEPLYLVDGSAFIFRAFHAFKDLKRSDGFPTNALYIVLRVMLKLLREEAPTRLAFFLDGPGPTFRNEVYEPYKAQREAAPEDLTQQLEPIRRAMRLLGFPVMTSHGCEADDLIATFTELAHTATPPRPVVIVGADKDLKQLLHKGAVLWDPGGKQEKLTTLEDFTKETGLTPAQWPDFQALVGDASDNIPGVPGVGKKIAEKLLARHHSLEALRDAVLDAHSDLTPAERKKLADHTETMFLFRDLTTLRPDQCPTEGPYRDVEDLAVSPPDHDGLLAFLDEFEFRSMKKELPPRSDGASASPAQLPLFAQPEPSPHAAADESLVPVTDAAALSECPGARLAMAPTPGGLAFATQGAEEAVVVLYEGPLAPCLERFATAAVVAAPDVKSLYGRFFEEISPEARTAPSAPAVPWLDVGVAAYLLAPEERDYTLSHLLQRYAAELPRSYGESPTEQARGCLALSVLLEERLRAAELDDLLRTMETPLIEVLAEMERAGVRIDMAAFAEFLKEVTHQAQEARSRIMTLAGREFNPRSSAQLAEVLFTDLGLKPKGKTPGGAASTSQAVLERLADEHAIVQAVLEFRKLEKLRSTYLEPLPKLVSPRDGRLHTTFNQTATATGRLSSSNPNLQNIPIRGPQGGRMRSCFIAAENTLLVAADYSQIELRVLAHMSRDPTLLEAFTQGEDIHARTAGVLFDKDPEQITPDERRSAKTINFGLIYGMGPQKLAQDLGVSLTDAKAFIQRYFERLNVLRDFYAQVEEEAKARGYVTTLAKRRRLLPELHSRNAQLQGQARRQAINTIIQGSAADIIKLAMLAVSKDEALQTLGARLILQVHDELLLETPAPDGDETPAREAGRRLETLMAGVAPLDVPLVVDWGVGKDWSLAH